METFGGVSAQATDIHRESNFPRDNGDCGARGHFQNTHRKDQVFTVNKPAIPCAVNTLHPVGKGHQSVMTVRFICCTGVSRLTQNSDRLMTDIAANTGHNTRASCFLSIQGRPLLNVQFNKSRNLADINKRLTAGDGRGINTARLHRFAQRAGAVTNLQSEILFGKFAQHAQRTHIGFPEERAFLAAHHQNGIVALGFKFRFTHPPGNRERRGDAGQSVIVAALRNTVNVRARNKSRKRTILTGQSHPNVASLIRDNFQLQRTADFGEIVQNSCFFRRKSLTCDTLSVFTHFTDVIENFLGKFKTFLLQFRHAVSPKIKTNRLIVWILAKKDGIKFKLIPLLSMGYAIYRF